MSEPKDGQPAPSDVPHTGGGRARQSNQPDRHMIEALVCPSCGGRLEWDRAAGELVSKTAGLAYPIRSGIPIMLVSEARRLED